MDQILQPLSADEALQLALRASERSDYDSAIRYLVEVLQREPYHETLYYFLAIQYAELTLYERAIGGMKKAVELKPDFDIADFQLGLLYLQTNQAEHARPVFERIPSYSLDTALVEYSHGYTALLNEQPDEAIQYFERGLLHGELNQPLQKDMQRVVEQLKQGIAEQDQTDTAFDPSGAEQATAATKEDTKKSSSHFLGAYLNALDDDHGPH